MKLSAQLTPQGPYVTVRLDDDQGKAIFSYTGQLMRVELIPHLADMLETALREYQARKVADSREDEETEAMVGHA